MGNKKDMDIEIIFLGTGTSGGIPVIGCHCEVCRSENKKDKRFRSSIYVQTNGSAFVIDTGPDFRSQVLINEIETMDSALITHAHKDHIAGLDDVKFFAQMNQKPFTIYGNSETVGAIRHEFSYAFDKYTYPGIPKFNLHEIGHTPFWLQKNRIIPIPVWHYRLPVLGYRIGNFAYITDASNIPDESFSLLENLNLLVINALREKPHIAHFSLSEALLMIDKIQPRCAYLTHVSHELGLHEKISRKLPENVFLACDGLKLKISE